MLDTIGPFQTAAATGGAGVATGTVTIPVDMQGLVREVYVEYNGSPPATSDVVIASEGTDPDAPPETILTLTNNNTSGWYTPRKNIHDASGNSQAGVWDYFGFSDKIVATLSQANDDDYIRFWLKVWRR